MTAEQFNSRRATLIEYLKVKVDQCDWHGVSDAANDLRVLEAEYQPALKPIWMDAPFKPFKPLDLSMYEPQSIPQPASET